jgi:hypothetical protein
MSSDENWGEPNPIKKFKKYLPKTKKESIEEEKITEENICNFLNSSTNYFHERYVWLNSSGNETYQLIYYSGHKDGLICPDITMYNDCWNNEVLMRIEIKRKGWDNPSSFYNEFYVEVEHFKNYLDVHFIEEIPVRIVFILGDVDETKNVYWESIEILDGIKKLAESPFREYAGSDGRANLSNYYYWNISDLKKLDTKTFYKTDMY